MQHRIQQKRVGDNPMPCSVARRVWYSDETAGVTSFLLDFHTREDPNILARVGGKPMPGKKKYMDSSSAAVTKHTIKLLLKREKKGKSGRGGGGKKKKGGGGTNIPKD